MDDDHRHCKVCGRVVGAKAEFCSDACRQKREAQLASRRQFTYLLYALMAFVLLVFFAAYVFKV